MQQNKTGPVEKLPTNLTELEEAIAHGYSLDSDRTASEPTIPAESRDTQRRAVVEAIEAYRYQDGQQAQATPSIVKRLSRIAKHFGKNGYQVAAELDRARQRVERSPSTAPEKASWFMAVVEARLKRQVEARKTVARAENLPMARSEVVSRDPDATWTDTRALVGGILNGLADKWRTVA